MKYLKVCTLFIFNSEIISLAALIIMAGMFLWDIAKAGMERTDCHTSARTGSQ